MTGPRPDELNRRLEAAGLPAAKVHRDLTADKNENAAVAAEFFERHHSAAERQRLREQPEQATPLGLLNEWADRSALARRRFAQLQPIKDPANELKRQRDRDRVREWSALHTERKRRHDKRYRERHPDQVKAASRGHYKRHWKEIAKTHTAYRDNHETARREDARRWRAHNREHRAEVQREYRSDPEKYAKILEQNRDRRRLINRLKTAGLPPRNIQAVPAATRRKELAAATDFFSRKRSSEERHRIKTEYEPTPPELLAEWAKSSALARRRSAELEKARKYVQRHEAQLREEAALDSRGRQAQGKDPLDIEKEIVARAQRAVSVSGRRPRPDTKRAATRDATAAGGKRLQSGTGEGPNEESTPWRRHTRKAADPDTGPVVTRDADRHPGPGLN